MYTEREYDIMLLEAQEENDNLLQEVALELLGNRAKRMVKNGEIGGGNYIPEAGGAAAPAQTAGAGGNPAGGGYAAGAGGPGY